MSTGIPESHLTSPVNSLFRKDYSTVKLRSDREKRPLWVCPDGTIFMETYSSIYKQAYDFLIAISDPVSRPNNIHEYKITEYSLYAAASLGLTTQDIVRGLQKMSKTEVDDQLIAFIRSHTEKCGKVKILLKNQRYYIESMYSAVLDKQLKDPVIFGARVDNVSKIETSTDPNAENQFNKRMSIAQSSVQYTRDKRTGYIQDKVTYDTDLLLPGTGGKGGSLRGVNQRAAMGILREESGSEDLGDDDSDTEEEDMDDEYSDTKKQVKKEEEVAEDGIHKVYSIEIDVKSVEEVRIRSNEMGYPMLEEYDFRNDTLSQTLPLELKPDAQIRHYQEKALSKMFGNGRARSGIIVLPCGAGKTLVGITAMATVRRPTLIYATTGVAVEQWRRQVKLWTNLPDEYIFAFTRSNKQELRPDAKVVITTYSMIAYEQRRSKTAERIMQGITQQEWGLVLLDEVHVAPADKFSKCVKVTHSRCKLGLTATLVREDEKVKDLLLLLGPKLYEASWLDLSKQGFIATIQCTEVWCNMTKDFYQAYMGASANHHKRMLLYVANPNKFLVLEMLLHIHENRGDKIMVFSDNVFVLSQFATKLRRYFIHGGTSDQERMEVLKQFSTRSDCNTIFISKIGDNSIDLPDTNVIIQISSHYSSRRQEAQRLGRILRPKSKRSSTGVDAHFYTLVSQDTREMEYATKRQRFLVDQGYSYNVIQQPEIERVYAQFTQNPDAPQYVRDNPLGFSTVNEQLQLLHEVMSTGTDEAIEVISDEVVIDESGKSLKRQYDADSDSEYEDAGMTASSKKYTEKRRK